MYTKMSPEQTHVRFTSQIIRKTPKLETTQCIDINKFYIK